MYAGFPKLQVTEVQPAVDVAKEAKSDEGCVLRTEFSVPKSVNLTFPAVCALLYNARSSSSSHNVFGEIIGLQLGDNVTITDFRMLPSSELKEPDRYNNDEKADRERRVEEAMRISADMKVFEENYSEENLDINVIGQFVICSARFNAYSKTTMNKLRDLHNQSQPAVLLVYDPFRTSLLGRPFIRAFTPTEAYYKYDTLLSKEISNQRRRALAGYAKESGITKHGALHEIPVKLDVDAFHKLNLQLMELNSVADSFHAIESLAVGNYIEALLSSIRSNTELLKSKLDNEGNARDNNSVPVGQDAESILLMKHLREQTDHLDALCDSALLYSSLMRDL